MFYFVLLLLVLALTGATLFFFIRSSELDSRLRQAEEEWRQREKAYTSELDKLEKIRHIPDIIEKARRSKEQVEAKLSEAQRRAEEILRGPWRSARSQQEAPGGSRAAANRIESGTPRAPERGGDGVEGREIAGPSRPR